MTDIFYQFLTPQVEACVGLESALEQACDPVERGAVRRFVQASLDDGKLFFEDNGADQLHGGPVAPALFPVSMFQRDFGANDPLVERAYDPDFDGITGSTAQGLPPLPLPPMSLLNGGTDVEILRYANHGEQVTARSRYDRIYEKNGNSGPMLFVEILTEYRTGTNELLMTVKKTQIRRQTCA